MWGYLFGILFYALCDFLACTVGVRFLIAGHHFMDTYMIPIVCFHFHLTVTSECIFLHREGRRKLGHIIGTMAQGPRASLCKKQYSNAAELGAVFHIINVSRTKRKCDIIFCRKIQLGIPYMFGGRIIYRFIISNRLLRCMSSWPSARNPTANQPKEKVPTH